MKYKKQKRKIQRGKELNPALIKKQAKEYFNSIGEPTPSRPLSIKLNCSQKLIYDAFKGKAPLKLYEIHILLKDLKRPGLLKRAFLNILSKIKFTSNKLNEETKIVNS